MVLSRFLSHGWRHLLSIGSGEGISGCVAAPFDPIEYPENQRHTVRGSPGLLPGRTLRCLTYRSTSRAGLYIHNFVGSCYSSPYRADLSLTAFNAFGAARTEANGGCQYVTVIDVARLLFLDQELFPVPAYIWLKHFNVGDIPHKLPVSLPHLRILVLEVCFLELSSVLCVINSSPNLEKIKIKMYWDNDGKCLKQSLNNLLDNKDYTCLNVVHLKELEIISFRDRDLWMEFVKLIMAKSPVLNKTRIELNKCVSVNEQLKMLQDFLYLPLPRASSTGRFIIEHP
ncbi:hypothetical protein LXL04_012693 [Taraxacum kok-saghyz]